MTFLNGSTSPSPTPAASSGVKDVVCKSVTSRQNQAAGYRGNELEAWGTRRLKSQNTSSSVIIPKEEKNTNEVLLALVFLKNSRRRKKILSPSCGNEKPNLAKVASDLPQCTGWVHCGNLKLKNVIHPADFDTGFHFSRKHTKKGILNWKKKSVFYYFDK